MMIAAADRHDHVARVRDDDVHEHEQERQVQHRGAELRHADGRRAQLQRGVGLLVLDGVAALVRGDADGSVERPAYTSGDSAMVLLAGL